MDAFDLFSVHFVWVSPVLILGAMRERPNKTWDLHARRRACNPSRKGCARIRKGSNTRDAHRLIFQRKCWLCFFTDRQEYDSLFVSLGKRTHPSLVLVFNGRACRPAHTSHDPDNRHVCKPIECAQELPLNPSNYSRLDPSAWCHSFAGPGPQTHPDVPRLSLSCASTYPGAP